MLLSSALFLPPAVAVCWFGTRAAKHIRHSRGTKEDVLFMLAVCWSPLLVWFLAVLLSLSGSPT